MHTMHTRTPLATSTTSKMATSVKCSVYSNSRKNVANANGNGHSKALDTTPASTTTTVILSEQQVEDLLNNNNNSNASPSQGGGQLVTITPPSQDKVFECPEESLFYCQCIESMVLNRPDCPSSLVEFGAGDGSPVISALLKSTKAPPQMPDIQAYEISPSAAHLATTRAASVGLGDVYRVHNSCFWTGAVKEGRPEDKCLIANPPYIPAPDSSKLLMPALWGGVDGSNLTRDLLSAGFGSTMMMISAYSNPVRTLQHARDRGYVVADFLVQPLPFGTYSSQDVVRQHLREMKARGEAFYRDESSSNNSSGRRPYYFLAGVLFQKPEMAVAAAAAAAAGGVDDGVVVDLSEELLSVMCAL